MTLEQLRIFIEVATTQHLTRAAEALNLTPSAVSSSIKALEERHNVVLFNRIGRGIELTADGRIFLTEAQSLFAHSKAAERLLSELGLGIRGSLSIFASQTIASYWLPPLLADFKSQYPLVDLQLSIGNTEAVTQAVEAGLADIGYIEGIIQSERLEQISVGADRLVLVVGKSHPWCEKRTIDWKDLPSAKWILREQGSGTRSVFEDCLHLHGIDAAQITPQIEMPSNESICTAVSNGDYVTVVSELVVAPYLANGDLIELSLDLPKRSFLMLRHKQRARHKAQQQFCRQLHLIE